MENLSLSVPDLLTTVKQFVGAEKHPQLDQMLQRYMCKELGKQQLQLELRTVAGRDALRQALLAMVPQIDELQRKRELMKRQQNPQLQQASQSQLLQQSQPSGQHPQMQVQTMPQTPLQSQHQSQLQQPQPVQHQQALQPPHQPPQSQPQQPQHAMQQTSLPLPQPQRPPHPQQAGPQQQVPQKILAKSTLQEVQQQQLKHVQHIQEQQSTFQQQALHVQLQQQQSRHQPVLQQQMHACQQGQRVEANCAIGGSPVCPDGQLAAAPAPVLLTPPCPNASVVRDDELKLEPLKATGPTGNDACGSCGGHSGGLPVPPSSINTSGAAPAPAINGSSSTTHTPGPSTSSNRKSTLPVQALVHAFHCVDAQCAQKSCQDTKQVLKRMEAHYSQCPERRRAAAGPDGVSQDCKVCKLWQALHRTKNCQSACTGSYSSAGPSLQQGALSIMRSPLRPGAHPSQTARTGTNRALQASQHADAVRQKLRQLDPAQVKRMLLHHVRSCHNKSCNTCHKLRERIKASRAANPQSIPPPGSERQPTLGSALGCVGTTGFGGMDCGGPGLSMEGSWNPLAGGGFSSSLWRSGSVEPGWLSSMGSGSVPGAFPHPGVTGNNWHHNVQARRTKVRQRGRENIQPGSGLAVSSRRPSSREENMHLVQATRFVQVRVKLKGVRLFERTQRADARRESDATGSGRRSKKRMQRDDEVTSRSAGKRPRSERGGKTASVDEDEEPCQEGTHQIKHAQDRSADLEQNRFEVDSLVEVLSSDSQEWRLAVVRAYNEDLGHYTVQCEPVEENRHKQTGIVHNRLRMVCHHKECKAHALILAALPHFCDRCRKALMSSPQQRVFYQESQESAQLADAPKCIVLCSTCISSLRAEHKSKGNEGLDAEVQKFTRELQGDQGVGRERLSLDLSQLEETPLPSRIEGSDAPIMSNEVDARWAQCNHCHRWWHWMCAMYNDIQYKNNRLFFCPDCRQMEPPSEQMREALLNNDAENLTQIPMGDFIEKQVQKDLTAAGISSSPVIVRIVSSLLMNSYVPERLIEHAQALSVDYPKEFPYKSKALLAFQKRDGIDICLFALYVQEYGSDCPEPNKNRVYISYLDSVRYFQSDPPGHRSTVYHAVLVAYLQWTRMLGFKYVHIWVEPPKMGDEYIFFARSDQQRKPMKREKLREWYKNMLDKAKEKGVVESYGTMHDKFHAISSIAEIPLFHGDQWEITVPSLLGLDQEERTDRSKLVRLDSKDVLQKAQQEMSHLKRHFLVVVLRNPEEPPAKDEDPVISSDLTDSRQTFLGHCQLCHWQFNSPRHAQYSTMMILNHIHNKPSYCLEDCKRNRVEDGSFMVGCDVCDNWYHGDCVGVSKDEANLLDSYLCPNCVEKQVQEMG